ncbi:Group 3 truncated hemoglobin ctb [Arenibacter antarcticus]|uniref:Group III truncated hemoglobin n=1 Tax=Arenibacter antarcticus TaxID=2040469 RepID=A0ABW5VI46_9FLAO|nr:group III truncated hemoglobin [Arenibacter sp. H213]MCM4167270.1 globin [Arenibacter sp. H213]
MKHSIQHIGDIQLLVDAFYYKVRKDSMLAPLFNEVIKDNWEGHLKKMCTFWGTVLLGTSSYYGNPFMPHVNLAVEKDHFERWVFLFDQTLNENFEGEKAEEAQWRANKMAEMFHLKIKSFNTNNRKTLI